MVRLAAILILLAASSYGNIYSVTNDILSLNPNANTTTVQKGSQIRVTSVTKSGGNAYDLTGYTIRHLISDPADGYTMLTGLVTVIDATNGEYRSVSLIGAGSTFEVGKQYRGVSGAYTGNTLIATLYDSYITILDAYCSTCGVSGGGGGGSTSVTVTNLIVSTNIISVTVTNTGGGGGSGTLSGFNSATTGGVFLVVSNGWNASITNEGNVFTINTGLPKGATGVNQVATWNGTNWIATALGAPTPTPTVGTNKILWTTVWGVTNTWVAPSTQVMFTAWGAGGGGGSAGAGFAKALWVGSAGTIFDIVIGTGGNSGQTNNGPFAGSGISAGTTNLYNGGGATYIAISGTTNIILMAGGAGGGSGSGTAGTGGPGGGYWFAYQDGQTSGTQGLGGRGAWASNEYGLASTGGSNEIVSLTNANHIGKYLQGGHASTNGCTAGIVANLGGGGGGWFGGGGAIRTNATIGFSGNGFGGGGGLGYANTNFVSFAIIAGGLGKNSVSGSPQGQDEPTYTSGRGVGGPAIGAGANGCAGAMW